MAIFSEFLNFSIPLIIVGLVTVAIADIGKTAGKMLLVTADYCPASFQLLPTSQVHLQLAHRTGCTTWRSKRSAGNPPLLLRLHSAPLMNVMTGSGFSFHTGVRTGVTQQRRIEKCGTWFSGNYRTNDKCRHSAAAALYLRHIPQHDTFGTSIFYPDGVY